MARKLTYEELEQRVKELEKESIARTRVKEALRRSEETARALLNAASDAAILIDTEGAIIAINETAVQRLGKVDKEVVKTNLFNMFPPEVAKARKTRADEVVRSGEPVHFEDQSRGLVFKNTFYPLFRRRGKVEKLAIFIRDITDRRRAEEALRESEEKFRNLATSALDAMIIMDGDGYIIYWNEAAERIFGYTKTEAIGKDLHRLLAPERYLKAFDENFSHFKATGRGSGIGKILEMSAIRKDGSEFPIELSLSSFRHIDEWHALGIVRDITRRKLAEEEHLQKEKLQSILEMAGAVCHELNQPLQNLILSSESLTRDVSEGSSFYKLAMDMIAQAERIMGITRKLMGITKYETKDYIQGIKIIDIGKASDSED